LSKFFDFMTPALGFAREVISISLKKVQKSLELLASTEREFPCAIAGQVQLVGSLC